MSSDEHYCPLPDLTVREVNELARECAKEFDIEIGKVFRVIFATFERQRVKYLVLPPVPVKRPRRRK